MNRKGFLLVITQPSPGIEEEFNAWYDTEHLPERAALPGFETALRFVSVSGPTRYLAMYDLVRPETLATPEYLAVSGDRFSPWTKRVTARVRGYRAAGEQVFPGERITGHSARLLLLRFRNCARDAEAAILRGARSCFESRRETIALRLFTYPHSAGADFLVMVEARAPIDESFDPAAFEGHADSVDFVGSFSPY